MSSHGAAVYACEQTPVPTLPYAMSMSDAWIRRAVMLAIVLLVLHAVGSWAYAVLGPAAAILSALLVAAVSIAGARMAGPDNHAWFVVPTAFFTAVPLAARLWTLLTSEQSGWTRAVEFAPFVIGFAAPVLLLLFAYAALGRRAPHRLDASVPLAA